MGVPAELDRARTALTGLTPDQYPLTTIDVNWSETRFTQDFTCFLRGGPGVHAGEESHPGVATRSVAVSGSGAERRSLLSVSPG